MSLGTNIQYLRKLNKLTQEQFAEKMDITRQTVSRWEAYMRNWGKVSGLVAADTNAKLIGWNFPFVSQELQSRFGLHGYVAAYILPEGFQTNCPGVEYGQNREGEYAVITVTEPMVRPFERIPTGYKYIMDFLQANNFKDKVSDGIIGCFEHEYEKEGVHYMDIYVHAASVTKVDAYSTFN